MIAVVGGDAGAVRVRGRAVRSRERRNRSIFDAVGCAGDAGDMYFSMLISAESEKSNVLKKKMLKVRKGGTLIRSYNWRPQNGKTKVLTIE
jgi:hypothetical protein